MLHPVKVGKRTRYSYARIKEVMEMPHLLDIQRNSYKWFLEEGLKEILEDISPITIATGNLKLFFKEPKLGKPKYTLEECEERDSTYSAPIRVKVQLVNHEPSDTKKSDAGAENSKGKEVVIEQEVFMGDFPLMTETGTFIINGAERVIVSQLVRSPGVYYAQEFDQTGKKIFTSTVIPNRGAWIELETEAQDKIRVRIDRTRKMPVTYLLRALGFESDEEILELFDYNKYIKDELERDVEEYKSTARALEEVYKHIRPNEPTTSVENAQQLLNSLFFDPKRYDLAAVGRYKLSKKLGIKQRLLGKILAEDIVDQSTGEILISSGTRVTEKDIELIDPEREAEIFYSEEEQDKIFYKPIPIKIKTDDGVVTMLCAPTLPVHSARTVTIADIVASIGYLLDLMVGVGNTDDIDHLGNRRVRSVGELLQTQFRIGLSRMERVVRDRMTTQDSDIITPQNLINIKPVIAAMKEFFGSSQLSQFMDQNNPLSELTHKRRLSALGPGGLNRERAGFEVRDVHNSHYGRMCPIETPEGPNIGLIGALSNYARVNRYGFVETPYRKVDQENHKVTNEVQYLTADEEETLTIAQANEPLDDNDWFINERVTARHNQETTLVRREKVDFMDVSPKQVVSIATALIPFLENDDANRALMGANMQRQAVPLLRTQAPLVGTGMEFKAACDSGVMILAKKAGIVTYVDSRLIKINNDDGTNSNYKLQKFVRSNQGTCINQVPIVKFGEHIDINQPIADGPSTDHGELALGYNIIVAYMPWEGYNYEDAILLSENLIKQDIFTSIHIEEHNCDARDTKLGPEEVTRDIPNVAEDALTHLNSDGIIAIGADVRPGDILVGKVTPKGETELTAEERLLRAIFGEKAREVRDTSLRVPHGESGKIVDVKIFNRDNNDEMAPGVNKQVRVYIAQKRKISVGDKMSGRHGNKGVVSQIMRQEDMPFLPDGTPVDIVLNPLGVPSRMNIGQILETHLGFAVKKLGMEIKRNPGDFFDKIQGLDVENIEDVGLHIATPVFDGAKENDIFDTIELAGLNPSGKTVLFDGRTGERFENPVTVGCVYMLKLHHLVDDKIHARSTGPYSLVTQQPLGGKAQFGGQRFGEMEVWALEAYGASYTLQEILTVKSDDVVGRVKAYEAIVKGQNIPEPGVPESFKVLIKELQSIGLDIKVLSEDSKVIDIRDEEEDSSVKPILPVVDTPPPEPEPESLSSDIESEPEPDDLDLLDSSLEDIPLTEFGDLDSILADFNSDDFYHNDEDI
ncbi:MAG: DNA-directed RNA polymerase subunit beta [Selenomonadaceae bacterium]|nr:DNA-directed RNA polymerase subunit beta [Selenomonadaceae bacterium]